jgi:hypothetical protein
VLHSHPVASVSLPSPARTRTRRMTGFVQALGFCTLAVATTPLVATAQDDGAVGTFRLAMSTVMGPSQAGAVKDSTALSLFLKAAAQAKAKDDKAIQVASMRGAADLLSKKQPCTDSAERTLRAAMALAETGDRSAADALVRLLAATGRSKEAMSTLVAAYADVPSLGRAITRESMHFLQGQATVELADGHEAAALAALNQALVIAARLKQGDTSDSVAKPTGEVDEVNAWVMYDLGMLRWNAKSASVRQTAVGTAILRQILAKLELLDGSDDEPHPITRLLDRITVGAGATVPLKPCRAAPR